MLSYLTLIAGITFIPAIQVSALFSAASANGTQRIFLTLLFRQQK